MRESWPLSRLRATLVGLHDAAEDSIKKRGSSTGHSRTTRRRGKRPNEPDYSTKIWVTASELLAAKYVHDLIEEDLALDHVASIAADHLNSLLTSDATAQNALQLPDELLERRALSEALERLSEAVKQCQSTYDTLSDFQRRSVAKSMKQELWPALDLICQDLEHARDALLRHASDVCSRCGRYHDAKVCFSVQPAHMYSLRVQLLEDPNWAAVCVHLERMQAYQATLQRSLQQLQSLCHLLDNGWQGIRIVDQGNLFQAYIEMELDQGAPTVRPTGVSMISLRKLIRDGHLGSPTQVGERTRIVLALVLAYYYLHLSGTPLWPDSNVTPDVWFEADAEERIDLHRPFLTLRYDSTQWTGSSQESFNNPDRPSLPALGKLLLEIWLGRSLNWDDVRSAEQLPEFRSDNIGALFYAAAARCWSTKFIRSKGQLKHDITMYDEYASWVVKGLQYIGDVYQLRQSDIFGVSRKGIISAPARLGNFRTTPAPIAGEEVEDDLETNILRTIPSKVADEAPGVVCMHDDGSEAFVDIKDQRAAEEWFKELRLKVHPFLKTLRAGRKDKDVSKVKVAVLDTGAFFDDIVRAEGPGKSIVEYRTWCTEPPPSKFASDTTSKAGETRPDGDDSDGHGTQSTSVLIDVATQSRVYVAKIFEGRQGSRQGQAVTANEVTQQRIADAIAYATEVWKVDIISMSFGFDERCPVIEDAIDKAAFKGVLLFASASNYGALKPVTFPASHHNVICIHAMTGKGSTSDITTRGKPSSPDNFGTVGSAVKTWSVNGDESISRHCSGSSIATPIAAGIGACIIEMMRCSRSGYLEKCHPERKEMEEQRYDKNLRALQQRDGMEAVLRHIVNYSGSRDRGYSFLAPANFMCTERAGHDTTKIDNILSAIERR